MASSLIDSSEQQSNFITGFTHQVNGYYATGHIDDPVRSGVLTRRYLQSQLAEGERRVNNFLLPIIKRLNANRIIDVGCGIGAMTRHLLTNGLDAYGLDLPELSRYWQAEALTNKHFFVVGSDELTLPFNTSSIDLAYSLGVIEHVGTAEGHSTRLPDYHARRRQWILELYRTIKPGGHLLIGGPNRGFPIDVAHGPDAAAPAISHLFHRATGTTIHATWRPNFLCSYADLKHYLADQHAEITPLSVRGFLEFSRVPRMLRFAVRAYSENLPRFLLGTGFNPWVMAVIRKNS